MGTPITLITRPMRCGPAACASIVCPTGRIVPAPRPCTTRNAISEPIDHAAAASAEPRRKSASEASQTCFAPKRSVSHPASGMTLANASMYPVRTHWIVEMDAPSSSPSVGIATLTIVMSRIVMIVPSTTTAPRTRICLSSLSATLHRLPSASEFESSTIHIVAIKLL